MADTSEPKSGSSGVIVVVVGLMVAATVFLVALVLRTNERGAQKTDQKINQEAETNEASARRPALLKAAPPGIESWIKTEMKNRNSKVAIVNVWATWCEPCRQEMPELAKFNKKAPVFLVSADNESDEPSVRDFLASAGVDFESALIEGDQQVFIEVWKNKSAKSVDKQWSMTLPVTFVVNEKAEVLSFHVGTSDTSGFEKMVTRALDTARD